jgi:hypothetical protein
MLGFRVQPELERSISEAAARSRRKVADWIRIQLEDAVAAEQVKKSNEAAV